ncbi:PLP-dependent aminotransferase family protein [Tissierella pigra]|uniref:PLP-dependent aminotransferase family protein n=1 Tax=Tissierella pigra TaxID=2607614 RepID=A0A6N7XV74_9FIRM|nr:PLP-dependent aminotransferase family protein [Tissierella pigra]MBU5428353.1 PLP-dependent aminotransferase family protein [Tissierella pigra]MSU01677.1 PLP-dependent aminotransferase family protein [Tissierella pigra]
MEKFKLNKKTDTPLYIQLYENFKTLIEEDQLENEKLPSIRNLANSLGVNNVTVVSAYKLLEKEGYVYSIKGSGTYIRKLPVDTISYLEEGDMDLMVSGILPISNNSINFASMSPTPDLFPIEEFKRVLIEVLDRDAGLAFLYPEITGYDPLRGSISKFLKEHYNTVVNKEQILITSGGQQGLDIISKTLINPGDCIFVENPTYSGALGTFKSRGAKIIGIPINENGIDIIALKSYIKKYRPKFLYIMTNYQSPTTYSYDFRSKEELLLLSKEYGFYIIEDDFLTDLTFSENKKMPLKSIDRFDQVIFIKSFSKIFMPGVRIGFITLPNKLFKEIIKAKHTTDISSSGYLQRAFDLYLRQGYWKNHIEKIKAVYSKKYKLMTEGLDRLSEYGVSYIKPDGGLSIWLKLPKNIDSINIYNECAENGLAIVPGKVFFVDDSIYSNYIRLSFGQISNEEIIEGLRILENIISKPFRDKESNYLPFI